MYVQVVRIMEAEVERLLYQLSDPQKLPTPFFFSLHVYRLSLCSHPGVKKKASETIIVCFVARIGFASTVHLRDCLRSCPQSSGVAGCLVWLQLENGTSWHCPENRNPGHTDVPVDA